MSGIYNIQILSKPGNFVHISPKIQVPDEACLVRVTGHKSAKITHGFYPFKVKHNLEENTIGLTQMHLSYLYLSWTSDKVNITFFTFNQLDELGKKNIKYQVDQSDQPLVLTVTTYPVLKTSQSLYADEWIKDFKNSWQSKIKPPVIFPDQPYLFRQNGCCYRIVNQMGYCQLINSETIINLVSEHPDKLVIVSNDLGQLEQFTQKSLEELGVGGLQKQYHQILRRIFASRLLDPKLAERLAHKHVKGLILYGPPGCGKTLISKQFSQLLTQVDPIVVNGPEILNKFVGQSEENIRKLFDQAQQDPDKNRIHVIIFDEIDAICRARGSGGSSSHVGDSLVNQLLACLDGVKTMENILVIGLTNRRELLDPALLRPGRFEVHLYIGLPDLLGRKDIFHIYLKNYQQEGCLEADLSTSKEVYDQWLDELANRTVNYSGAEIAGVVRSAVSYALNRQIDWDNGEVVSNNKKKRTQQVTEIQLKRDDLDRALAEVHPQWSGLQGKLPTKFEEFQPDQQLLETLQTRLTDLNHQTMSHLIIGSVKSGKTQTLVHLAERLIERKGKYVLYIRERLNESLDSLEVVEPDYLFFDDLLDLIKYIPLGCRYQGDLVLKFKSILKSRVPMVATTNDPKILKELGLLEYFDCIYSIDEQLDE